MGLDNSRKFTEPTKSAAATAGRLASASGLMPQGLLWAPESPITRYDASCRMTPSLVTSLVLGYLRPRARVG
eukprot:1046533-Rhodomonas_salina.3